MMMLPTRVLPSNAPPLLDGDGLPSASRVLQEHSGNRQINDFVFAGTEYEQKYSGATLFNENSYEAQLQPQHQHQQQQLPQQQVTHQLHHPRPQHRHHTWKFGQQRSVYPYTNPAEDSKIQVEAEYLHRRFKQSESYIKYRNRQTKGDKSDDQKWPEHLEKAFFRALVTWTPMGRRQLWHKDKRRGRNELIADCIEELTGEKRGRKQVSSHIQVLKPFVEGDPYIMRYLDKDDLSAKDGRRGHGGAYGVGRRASNYPVTSLPHAARAAIPSLNNGSTYSISKLKHEADVIEPVEFQMFIQQKSEAVEGEEEHHPRRLHTYTRSVPNPREQDLHMPDWQTIGRDFPLLATMHNQGKLDCNVIVAEASLAFPTHTFKAADGTAIPGVELGISFLCSSRKFAPTTKEAQVRCHNTFYENERVVGDSQTSEVRFGAAERSNCAGVVDTQVKFGSTFWAKMLGQMANRLLSTSRDWSEEVAAQIRSLAVLQEFFLVGPGGHERLLVIHWTFRQSTRAEGGASWRKLSLPAGLQQQQQHVQYGKLDVGDKQDAYASVGRQDSLLDCYSHYMTDAPGCQTQTSQSLPALQPPFEYDSASGSALSSATTWTGSASEPDFPPPQPNPTLDFPVADTALDFNAGNINIAYDPHTINFDNFDSSAFHFDAADFVADPTLEEYGHAWASGTTSFEHPPNAVMDEHVGFVPASAQHGHDHGDGFTAPPPTAAAGVLYESFESQYSQHSYHRITEQGQAGVFHGVGHDQQAYGGAGVAEGMKDEEALAALADASFLARALGE